MTSIVVFLASCSPPETKQASTSTDNDNNDDEENDDDDTPKVRDCASRDSCEDICDDIFDSTSEKFKCYELSYSQVNTLTEVADVLLDDTVDFSDLEDLNSSDVASYINIGSNTLIKIAEGDEVGDGNEAWDNTGANNCDRCAVNSKAILQWIAENEDIAETILENADMIDFGIELFIKLAAVASAPFTSADTDYGIEADSTNGRLNFFHPDGTPPETNPELTLDVDFGKDDKWLDAFANFVQTPIKSSDKFMDYAIDEDNEFAVEYGHKVLVETCKNLTDEDEDDEEVKQCLQMAYCEYNDFASSEGIFDDLDDYSAIGRVDHDRCEDIEDEDRIDNLFK